MRVTKEMLQRRVALLNKTTGAALYPHMTERDSDGRLIANAGTYYIGGAYGGYRLERMSEGGGASDISPRLSKPALYDWINAYIDGIEIGLKL